MTTGKVERLNLSLKTEAFKNVIPINLEKTIERCRSYQDYYNGHRPHQAINGNTPGLKENLVSFRSKFTQKSHIGKSITTFEIEKIAVA